MMIWQHRQSDTAHVNCQLPNTRTHTHTEKRKTPEEVQKDVLILT